MNYLKTYRKLFESHDHIHQICKEYGIKDYVINDDGSIDVRGNVNLSNKWLSELPLKFRQVSGHFFCYNNQLTSLDGAPQSVGGYFYCDANQLVTLEGAPQSVGDFSCSGNPIHSLVGSWIGSRERRMEMLEYFNDLDIIRGNEVILDRLEEFMDMYGVKIDIDLVKKHYKII